MNSGKKKALLEWVGALGVGECLDSLQQLSSGLHLARLVAIIEEREVEDHEDAAVRWAMVKKCLEACYHTGMQGKVDFDLIQTHGDELEIAKAAMLCLCAGVLGSTNQKFVKAAMQLSSHLQYEVKEVVEGVLGDSLSTVPSLINTSWSSILIQPLTGSSSSLLNEVQRTSTPLYDTPVRCPPPGRMMREAVFSMSTADSSILGHFCSPSVSDGTPRRGTSPMHRNISSPVVADKIELHRKERRIRELERNLNSEQYQRSDTEALLKEKNSELEEADKAIQILQKRYNDLRRESRCLKDSVTDINSIREENLSLESRVGKLHVVMQELVEEQDKSRQLDELNNTLMEENVALNNKLASSDQARKRYQQLTEQLRAEKIQLQELLSSQRQHSLQLESEVARLDKELVDFRQAAETTLHRQLHNSTMDYSMTPDNLGVVVEMELQNQITQLQHELEKGQCFITEQSQAIETLDGELGECRTELQAMARQYEAEKSQLVKEKQNIMSCLEEKQQEVEELISEVNSCRGNLSQVEALRDQLEADKTSLISKCSVLEADVAHERGVSQDLTCTLTKKEAEFSAREDEAEAEKKELKNILLQATKCREELLDQVTSAKEALTRVDLERCQLEKDNSSLLEQCSCLNGQLASEREKSQSLNIALNERTSGFEAKISQLEVEKSEWESTLNETCRCRDDLHREVVSLKKSVDEMQTTNCEMEKEKHEWMSRCRDVEVQLNTGKEMLKECESSLQQSQLQVTQDTHTISVMSQEMQSLSKQVTDIQKECDSFKTQLQEMESMKTQIDTDKEKLAAKCLILDAQLLSEKQASTEVANSLSERLTSQEVKFTQLVEEKKHLEGSLQEANRTQEELQMEVASRRENFDQIWQLKCQLEKDKEDLSAKCNSLEVRLAFNRQTYDAYYCKLDASQKQTEEDKHQIEEMVKEKERVEAENQVERESFRAELSEVRSQKNQLEADTASITSQCASLNEQLMSEKEIVQRLNTTLGERTEELETMVTQLSQEREHLEASLQDAIRSRENLELQVTSHKEMLNGTQALKNQLETDKERLSLQCSQLEAHLNTAQAQIEAESQARIGEMESGHAAVMRSMREQVVVMEQKVSGLEDELLKAKQSARKMHSQYEGEKSELKDQMMRQKEQLAEEMNKLTDEHQEILSVKSQAIEKLSGELNECRTELQGMSSQYEAEKSQLVKEKQNIMSCLEEKQQEVEELISEVNSCRGNLSQMEALKDQLEADKTSLNSKCSDLEDQLLSTMETQTTTQAEFDVKFTQLELRIQELDNLNSQLQVEKDNMVSQHSINDQESKILQARIEAESQSVIGEAESRHVDEMNKMREQVAGMVQKVTALEDELYESQQAASLRVSELQGQHEELMDQLAGMDGQREELALQVSELMVEHRELQQGVEGTRRALDTKGEQCIQLHQEVANLREQMDEARGSLDAAQGSVVDWQTRAEAESGLRAALEQQLQDSNEEYQLQADRIRDELAHAVATNQRLEEQCSAYSEKLEAIEKQLIESATQHHDLEHTEESYRCRYQTMVEKCDDYLGKVKLLEEAVLKAQSVSVELEQERAHSRRLETQVSQAEQKIRELEEQLEEAEDVVFGLEEKLSCGVHASTIQESLNATQLHMSRQEESHAAELTAAQSRHQTLECQLQQAGQFVEEVKFELEKLHQKVITMEAENVELRATQEDSDMQILQLTNALNEANRKMCETQGTLERSDSNSKADERCIQLESKLIMSRNEVARLEEHLASSSSCQAKLEEDIRNSCSSSAMEQNLQAELLEAHKREQGLEEEIESCTAELQNCNENIEQLSVKLKEETAKAAQLELQIEELQSKLSQFEGQVVELEGRSSQLEVDKEGLEQLMENYSHELAETKSTLQHVDVALRDATSRKTALERELAECRHQLNMMEDANEQHQLVMDERLQKTQAYVQRLEDSRRRDTGEQRRVEEMLRAAQRDKQELAREVEKVRQSSSSIIQQLREELDSRQHELGQSAQQFACMENEGHQQLYEARQRCKALEQQLATMTRQHQQQLSEASNSKSNLQQQIAEVANSRASLEQQLSEVANSKVSLQQQLSETLNSKHLLDKKFAEAEKRFKQLREVTEKYKEGYNSKKELVVEATRERDEAVVRAENADLQLQQLRQEMDTVNKQLEDATDTHQHLNDRVQSLEAQLEFANKQLFSRPPGPPAPKQPVLNTHEDLEMDHGALRVDDLRRMSMLGRSPSLPARLDQLRVHDGLPTPRRDRKDSIASLNSSQSSVASGPLTRSRRASLENSLISEGSASTVDAFDPARSGHPPRGFGSLLSAEDEPDDFIQWGRLSAIHQKTSTSNPPWGRLTELQRRNTLCLPHLKTSYPVEMQTKTPSMLTDDQLKSGLPETPKSDRVLRKRRSDVQLEGTPESKKKNVQRSPSTSSQGLMPLIDENTASGKKKEQKKRRWGLRTPRRPSQKPSSQSENEDAEAMPPPSKDSLAFSIGFTPKKISRLLPGSLGKKATDQVAQVRRKISFFEKIGRVCPSPVAVVSSMVNPRPAVPLCLTPKMATPAKIQLNKDDCDVNNAHISRGIAQFQPKRPMSILAQVSGDWGTRQTALHSPNLTSDISLKNNPMKLSETFNQVHYEAPNNVGLPQLPPLPMLSLDANVSDDEWVVEL